MFVWSLFPSCRRTAVPHDELLTEVFDGSGDASATGRIRPLRFFKRQSEVGNHHGALDLEGI